jgi:DNA-binding MarR family transcriptional regulator
LASDAELKLDNQICFALYAASRAMTSVYRPVLDKLGLTYPQYLVMLVLWEQDALRLREIGARLHLDSGTLTPLLRRLEGAGLIYRARRVKDEREVEVSLTTAGKRLKQRALSVPKQIVCMTGRPIKELAALRDDLKKLLCDLTNATDTKGSKS